MNCVFEVAQMSEEWRGVSLLTVSASMDYVKVFYKLERNKMWEIMFETDFLEYITRAVQSLCKQKHHSMNTYWGVKI
jgi:hypothetical protein